MEKTNINIKKWRRLIILLIWFFFFGGIGAFSLLMFGVSKGLLGELPTFEELENPKSFIATEVFAADGYLLGKYYSKNRTPVGYKDISPHLLDALIATEDARFYQHSGIDFRSMARAVSYTHLTLPTKA